VGFKRVSDGVIVKDSALYGDYELSGFHHGRQVYKKKRLKDGDVPDVCIYFWNQESSFNGWWFGRAVGSEEVWARHESSSEIPPQTGWSVVHEADSQLELTVQPIKKVRTIPATPKAAYSKRPGIRRPVVKLPEPWVAVEHQGTVYYWNNETEESRWCLPEGGVQLPDEHTTGLDAIPDVRSCIIPIPQIKQDCLPCLDEKGLPKTTNVASRHLTTSMHHDKRKLTDTHPAHMPEVDADHKARSPESQHSQQYHQSRSERGAVPHKCEASQERKGRSLELQHSKVHCQPQSPDRHEHKRKASRAPKSRSRELQRRYPRRSARSRDRPAHMRAVSQRQKDRSPEVQSSIQHHQRFTNRSATRMRDRSRERKGGSLELHGSPRHHRVPEKEMLRSSQQSGKHHHGCSLDHNGRSEKQREKSSLRRRDSRKECSKPNTRDRSRSRRLHRNRHQSSIHVHRCTSAQSRSSRCYRADPAEHQCSSPRRRSPSRCQAKAASEVKTCLERRCTSAKLLSPRCQQADPAGYRNCSPRRRSPSRCQAKATSEVKTCLEPRCTSARSRSSRRHQTDLAGQGCSARRSTSAPQCQAAVASERKSWHKQASSLDHQNDTVECRDSVMLLSGRSRSSRSPMSNALSQRQRGHSQSRSLGCSRSRSIVRNSVQLRPAAGSAPQREVFLKPASPSTKERDDSPALQFQNPLTKQPPGRQMHLPGVVLSDYGLGKWLQLEAQTHLEWVGGGPLDCIDVSHNNLTDEGIEQLMEFMIKKGLQTKRLKLFHNKLRDPRSLCNLLEDPICGVGAKNGLQELHLSHNQIELPLLEALLHSLGKQVATCGKLRPPLWLRLERNGLPADLADKLVKDRSDGLQLCQQAAGPKSRCSLGHCRQGADVHIVFVVNKRS